MELVIIVSCIVAIFFLGYVAYHQRITLIETRFTLRDKNKHIASLVEELNTAKSQHKTLEQQVIEYDNLLINMRRDLSAQSTTLDELTQQNDAYHHQIITLKESIAFSERGAIQSNALFSTLASVAYDIVLVLDQDGEIVALNRSADALFGDKNPIGERLTDIIKVTELDDIIQRALDETETVEEQIVINQCYYRARSQTMRYSENSIFVGLALQDITQLVRLNRARRDMVANISHELRTPIANISLHIDSLFHDQDRPKRKASIATLRDIARETDSLLWLVQELLDLSMIESGQAIMKLIPNNLLEIVNEAVERLRDQLDVKQLNVVRHVPARLTILCDRDQTRRVLMNLMRNAIKWSPVAEAITISAMNRGDEVQISVFDNGQGIPDNQVDRIFERFYQLDTARSKGDGSGLGLAICKHIVEAHGGKIWAEGNSKGNGGRLNFTLIDAGTDEPVGTSWMDAGQHDSGLNELIAQNRGYGVERDEKGYPINANPPIPANQQGYIEFEDDEYSVGNYITDDVTDE